MRSNFSWSSIEATIKIFLKTNFRLGYIPFGKQWAKQYAWASGIYFPETQQKWLLTVQTFSKSFVWDSQAALSLVSCFPSLDIPPRSVKSYLFRNVLFVDLESSCYVANELWFVFRFAYDFTRHITDRIVLNLLISFLTYRKIQFYHSRSLGN